MRRRAATLLAALLLLLAGCATLGGNTAGGTTVTPAPVPDTPATSGGVEVLAPGVTENGVANAPRLASAHASVLANRSFSVNQTVLERVGNTTVARYVTQARFGAEPGRFAARLVQVDREDGRTNTRVLRRFGDGNVVYRSASGDGNQTVEAVSETPLAGYRGTLTNRRSLARMFGLVRLTVTDQFTRDGTRFVRLQTPEPTALPPLRNVTLVATVSERGVVRSYRLNYDVIRGDRRADVTVSLAYTDLGRTAVARPGWVDQVTDDG